MGKIIGKHPGCDHAFGISLNSTDGETKSGVPHRVLLENGHNEQFLDYMTPALERHHISAEHLECRKKLIESLKISGVKSNVSPYPKNKTTQKGNFAEIFLAEYLSTVTTSVLPVYRLRYNPNVDQSMKGDDVLMFDLESDPIRIIVGEAKFRTTPDKDAVIEMVDGLIRSNKGKIPVSLMFVAERLFQEGKEELGAKVQNCALQIAMGQLEIDYVGLLMSNHNAKNHVSRNTPNVLRNLLVISLGMDTASTLIEQAYTNLEGKL